MSLSLSAEDTLLDPAWRRWIATSLLLDIDRGQIVEVLESHGLDADMARKALASLESDPALEAGRWMAQRLSKLESILDIRQNLSRLAGNASVERRNQLSGHEFRDEYYARNVPVLLDDVASRWPALHTWNSEYLRSALGDESVEIMDDRDSDRRYEVNANSHRRTVAFSDYVDTVLATRGNNAYLVANNHLLEREAARGLWDDFSVDARYLYPDPPAGSVFMWFGPGGTITPLHHDVANILFTQVHGHKRVTLISPLATHCMYNELGVYSEVDLAVPDLDRFPRFANVDPIVLVIRPGDTLFIPVGWWHHVESLDTSITLSFTNFRWSNTFQWCHPRLLRT